MLRRVLLDERALVLGSILHHGGQPCHGGGLGGTLKAQAVAADGEVQAIDLSGWQHLDNATGGFAAYKGSLINLGLFQQADDAPIQSNDEEREEAQLTNTELSELGQALAQSFDNAVAESRYPAIDAKEGAIELDVLQEFGAAAGFCELRDASGADLLPLRNLFFGSNIAGDENSHRRRRMSLLLLMKAVEKADENGLMLDAAAFDDFTFYGRFSTGEGPTQKIRVPEELDDIRHRWRVFHFHSYLTVALESCLAGIVRAVRDHPAGLTLDGVLDVFDGPAAGGWLRERFALSEDRPFFELSPADSLALLGVDAFPLLDRDPEALEQFDHGTLIERNLRNLLVVEEAVRGSAGPAVAVLLLYILLLRHDATVPDRYIGWTKAKIDNSYSDVAIPQVSDALETYFGAEWWLRSNREIMSRLLWRFVVMQHQAMSYERGFGGSAPLFYVDGQTIVGTDLGYDDVRPLNARFPSALQILEDLSLIEKDPDRICLTSAGKAWLEGSLGGKEQWS